MCDSHELLTALVLKGKTVKVSQLTYEIASIESEAKYQGYHCIMLDKWYKSPVESSYMSYVPFGRTFGSIWEISI